jgi:hypothetical protein
MHKLVHAWAHDRLDVHERDRFVIAALELLLKPSNNLERDPEGKIRLISRLMANFGVVSELYKVTSLENNMLFNLLGTVASFVDSTRRWTEVYTAEKFILDKTARVYRKELPDTISAMNNLANTLGDQGHPEEAASMKKEALEKRQRILGEEHLDTITAMSNLAITLGDQGYLEEAASVKKDVLEKRQKILGEEHPDTSTPMASLLVTLDSLSQYDPSVVVEAEILEKKGANPRSGAS